MKRFTTVLTRTAQEDQLEIARYIADELQSPEAARHLIISFREAVVTLEHTPARHPLVKDAYLAAIGYRFMRVENYLLFYTINEDTSVVAVIRILYTRRNWINLLT